MPIKMQALLVFFRGEQEVSIPVDKEEFLIGRSTQADIRINDDVSVSRRHCRIMQEGEDFFLEDLGSRNGTGVNGKRVDGRQQLKRKDIIKIGSREVIFLLDRRTIIANIVEEPTEAMRRCVRCRGLITPQEVASGLAEKGRGGHICPECSGIDARLQTVFHNYDILGKIAQGGMGVIYKARHRVLDKIVAIKMIREGREGEHDLVKRFTREVRLGAMVKHPNIVRFIDAGDEDGMFYIVMEYYEGISLAEKLGSGRKLIQLASRISGQLFDAVQAIHDAELVHRDIKPANIILLNDDTVKLIDFGLVKSLSEETGSILTGTGIGIGTPWYIPPEQFRQGRDVDERADIYALGATLYHTVCGQPPIGGSDQRAFFKAMKEFHVVHPCELNSRLSRGTGDWLMKALAKEPEDRYPDIASFRKAYKK